MTWPATSEAGDAERSSAAPAWQGPGGGAGLRQPPHRAGRAFGRPAPDGRLDLLIPGTASVAHLRENLAAEGVTLDDEALRQLDGIGA